MYTKFGYAVTIEAAAPLTTFESRYITYTDYPGCSGSIMPISTAAIASVSIQL